MTIGSIGAALSAALGLVLACASSAAFAAESSPASLLEPRADAASIVVQQGATTVTLGDIDTWMLDVPEKDRAGFIRSPERIENMLFQILLMKQINQEARAAKLDQQPRVANHMRMASERTLARYQTEAVRQAIKAPDFSDLAKESYLSNPEQHRDPDVATVVHLLISEGERGSDAAQKLIQKLYRQAQKDPTKLEALAVKYSDDTSAVRNQGILKDVSLADLDPAFADATRKLKPGQLSAPVKSEFGWHLIRLDAITLGRLPAFDDIKVKIKTKLEQDYVDSTFRAYLDGLRQRTMEPNAKVLEQLPFRYGGAPEATSLAPAAAASEPAEAK